MHGVEVGEHEVEVVVVDVREVVAGKGDLVGEERDMGSNSYWKKPCEGIAQIF